MYDPTVGGFLSVDPIVRDAAANQSWNGYGYVEGRLLSATDPSGWQTVDCPQCVVPIEPSMRTIVVTASRLYALGTIGDFMALWGGADTSLQPSAPANEEAEKREPQGEEQLCLAGNALQEMSKDAFRAGVQLERAGLTTAAIGFAAIGPKGAVPGIALAGLGGALTVAGSVGQLVGGALQFSSDPSAGGHNIAAGGSSLATAGAFYVAAGAYTRPGSNYVAREHNVRVATGFGAAGASVDLLSALSSFFEPQAANCQSTDP